MAPGSFLSERTGSGYGWDVTGHPFSLLPDVGGASESMMSCGIIPLLLLALWAAASAWHLFCTVAALCQCDPDSPLRLWLSPPLGRDLHRRGGGSVGLGFGLDAGGRGGRGGGSARKGPIQREMPPFPPFPSAGPPERPAIDREGSQCRGAGGSHSSSSIKRCRGGCDEEDLAGTCARASSPRQDPPAEFGAPPPPGLELADEVPASATGSESLSLECSDTCDSTLPRSVSTSSLYSSPDESPIPRSAGSEAGSGGSLAYPWTSGGHAGSDGGAPPCAPPAQSLACRRPEIPRRACRPPRCRACGQVAAPPSVTILKPLKGIDDGLEANIASFLRQDYGGEHAVVLSVASEDDPAAEIARRLSASSARCTLVVGEDRGGGLNPKINNLLRGYEASRHAFALVSDSNIRVEEDYLTEVMRPFECACGDSIGLISSLVRCVGASSLGSLLDAATLNGFVARWICGAGALGRVPVVGKSIVIRRRALDAVGGLRAFAAYADEDYLIGERLRCAGFRVLMSGKPVFQHLGPSSVIAYLSRHARWGRIRNSVCLGHFERWNPTAVSVSTFFQEVACNAVGAGLAGCVGAVLALGVPWAPFVVLHTVAWGSCDVALLNAADPSIGPLTAAWVWMVREIAALGLWVYASAGTSIDWRGNRVVLGRGGGILQQ